MDKKRKENIIKFVCLLKFFGTKRCIKFFRIIKDIDPKEHYRKIHFDILDVEIDISIKDMQSAVGIYLIREFGV